MSESKSHKLHKRKAAGKSGKTEVKLPGGRRLDAATRNRATEIERSGNFDRILVLTSRSQIISRVSPSLSSSMRSKLTLVMEDTAGPVSCGITSSTMKYLLRR